MKKTKKVSFVKLINEWTKAGSLPSDGLCTSFTPAEREIFDLFEPTLEDKLELNDERLSTVYWGSGKGNGSGDEDESEAIERRYGITPLRQTLLCFCAILNNEL